MSFGNVHAFTFDDDHEPAAAPAGELTRFGQLDLSDDHDDDDDLDDGPGRAVDLSDGPAPKLTDAQERAQLGLTLIAPASGQVAGDASGAWYGAGAQPKQGPRSGKHLGRHDNTGGDVFLTCKASGVSGATKDGQAITGTATESPAQRAMRLAGITFGYELEPALRILPDGGTGRDPNVPRNYVVRSDTRAAVGIVSEGYGLLQPDVLLLVDDVAGELGVKIERAGCLKGGAVLFLQTGMEDFEGPGGRRFRTRALVSTSADGSSSFCLAFNQLAVDCRNFFASVLGAKHGVTRVKHTAGAATKVDAIRRALKAHPKHAAAVRERLLTWASRSVTEREIREHFLPEAFGYEPGTQQADLPGRTRNRVERFWDSYQYAPGADPGNWFGVAQGWTNLTSHGWNSEESSDQDLFLGAAGKATAKGLQLVHQLALN